MTQCVIAGKGACQCQPQEGMECPHGTPSLVQAALNAESSLLRERIRVLREALADAIVCVQDWSAYVAPYYLEKHDLHGDLARLRAALEATR